MPLIRERIGDALIAGLVLALLAAAIFGGWRLYVGFVSGCIKVRYGYDCRGQEPWSYGISMLVQALGAISAQGSSIFIAFLRIMDRR